MMLTLAAAAAFGVGLLAVAAAILYRPRKTKVAKRTRGPVKLVILDGQAPAAELPVDDVVAHEPIAAAPIPPAPEIREDERIAHSVVATVVDTEDHSETPQAEVAAPIAAPKRGSFLAFGMRQRERDVAETLASGADAQEPVELQVAPIEVPTMATIEEYAPRPSGLRKLFSGLGSTRVKKKKATSELAGINTGDAHSQPSGPIAQVTTDAGSVTVDAKGAIREEPVESILPADEFARADALHDSNLVAQRELEDAEHRRRLEVIAAERAASDAAALREQEIKDAEARRLQEEKDAEHRRELERIEAESAALARVEAYSSLWWIRLDPEKAEPSDAERTRYAGSLEAISAEWAGKLIARALEQDPSERVRARLIGALARGGHRADSEPFVSAYSRSEVEKWAVTEALTPFAHEAEWILELVTAPAAVEVDADDAANGSETTVAEIAEVPVAEETATAVQPETIPLAENVHQLQQPVPAQGTIDQDALVATAS